MISIGQGRLEPLDQIDQIGYESVHTHIYIYIYIYLIIFVYCIYIYTCTYYIYIHLSSQSQNCQQRFEMLLLGRPDEVVQEAPWVWLYALVLERFWHPASQTCQVLSF